MKANQIYDKAIRNGVTYCGCCVNHTARFVDDIMNRATIANKKKVYDIAKKTGAIYNLLFCGYNPYRCYKTDKYLIYVHSSIEYFFKINED